MTTASHPCVIVRSNSNTTTSPTERSEKEKLMTNINKWEQAFLHYDLENNTWVAYETLPVNYSLTAGEDENTYAFVDISHWTQEDLDEFDKSEADERLTIIESLEFSEFTKQMSEHGSDIGIVFGMGGRK